MLHSQSKKKKITGPYEFNAEYYQNFRKKKQPNANSFHVIFHSRLKNHFNTFPKISIILIPKLHKDPQQRNFRTICFMNNDMKILN